MRHNCPDGTSTRLVRDPKAPIGEFAMVTCPRCGWAMHGQKIIDNARAVFADPKIRAALR